jgi:hypothetical protein
MDIGTVELILPTGIDLMSIDHWKESVANPHIVPGERVREKESGDLPALHESLQSMGHGIPRFGFHSGFEEGRASSDQRRSRGGARAITREGTRAMMSICLGGDG